MKYKFTHFQLRKTTKKMVINKFHKETAEMYETRIRDFTLEHSFHF